MPKKRNTKAIMGGRLARLRENYISYTLDGDGNEVKTFGMKQSEFAVMLQELVGENYTVSVSLVSAWENGRRPVAEHFIVPIMQIFGCSRAYLSGESNEKNGERGTEESLNEIKADSLDSYDGEPIWVVFTTYEYLDGWAIYNAVKKQLVFKDGVRAIRRISDLKFFTQIPDYEFDSGKGRRSLEVAQILSCKNVYVLMASPDATIRARYNGWYNVDADRECLVDPWNATVLPLSGVNVSYKAYSMGDRKKFIQSEEMYD